MAPNGTERFPLGSLWGPAMSAFLDNAEKNASTTGWFSDLLVVALAARKEIIRLKGRMGFDPTGPATLPRGYAFLNGGVLVSTRDIMAVYPDPECNDVFNVVMRTGHVYEINSDWEEIAGMLRSGQA